VAIMVAGLMVGFSTFTWVYRPLLAACLRHKIAFLLANVLFVLFGFSAWLGLPRTTGWMPNFVQETAVYERLARALPGLGTDFMPPFDEGSFLYMPTTTPHASIGQAA